MCGIVGYVGNKNAYEVLISGLERLEYRGYDSSGVAVRNNNGKIKITKAEGRLDVLKEKIKKDDKVYDTGIGHTRWATHGEPTETNAHPHSSNDGSIVLVHNGIIENYQELKNKLEKKGYVFKSSTDTEVAVNLIDYYYKKYNIGPVDAIAKTMVRVRGSYAFAIMFKDYPEEVWVARKDSPMIIGVGEDENYVASDVPAVLNYTKDFYYIDNLEMACLTKDKTTFYNLDGEVINKKLTHITWDQKQAEKNGYEHFMIKEIHEQPFSIKNTFNSYITNNKLDFKEVNLDLEFIKNISEVVIVACGSAYHAGITTKYVMEKIARVPVKVELASEFRYEDPILNKDSLVVIISQSGETADSLAALREAKEKDIKTLAIVNVIGSSIAREADYVMYTYAGPEIAVATTKAYSAQLIAGYLLSLKIAEDKKVINKNDVKNYIEEINKIPDIIECILKKKDKIQKIAEKFYTREHAFFIGRGLDYTTSLEGSLKLKEISYIHSEAYAAGELKHGTISLIEDSTLVIAVSSQNDLVEKMRSNIVELKARGAYVLGVTSLKEIMDASNDSFKLPTISDVFMPSITVIPLQLLGYYISIAKGLDVDKPRNLAKSVTVE